MPAASASAAAAAALSSTASASGTNGTSAAFAIPGKSIQVLPIGLGVFAGVSVIALVVVGLVTYERTKYRRVCHFQLRAVVSFLSFFRNSAKISSLKTLLQWDMAAWRECHVSNSECSFNGSAQTMRTSSEGISYLLLAKYKIAGEKMV